MFVLQKLSFKNILSYGNILTEIDFNNFNSVYIGGANASGKSSFVEALFFGLYGRPYRKMKTEGLVNKINQKNMYVKVDFTSGGIRYIIERGLKPNILKVYKNSDEIKEGVSKKEFQKEINKIIGIDYQTFNQICLVDSTFYKPFMQLSAAEKRNVIDNIFGLNNITDMMYKCREYKSKLSDRLYNINSEIELIKEKIYINEQFSKENIDKEIEICQNNIKNGIQDTEYLTKIKITKSVERKSEKEKLIQIKNNLQKEINIIQEIDKKISGEKFKINDYQKRIDILKSGECHTCGSYFINPEKRINKTQKQIEVSMTKSKHLMDKNEITKKNKIKLSNEVENQEFVVYNLEREFDKIGDQIDNINNTIKNEKQKIDRLNKKKKQFNVDNLKYKLNENEKKYKKYLTMMSTTRRCETLLSDSGIRSYIIRKFLPLFNQSLKKYLGLMEAQFHFEFDGEFNQKINERYRNSYEYDNLSSGQKARINLAVLFAFIEFAEKKSGSRLNILILDEVVDSINLDGQGKESVLNILKNSIKKKLMFISHDKELMDMFDVAIKVRLKGTHSTMEYQ